MNKEYIISEKELIDLLADSHKLNALECDGVDNWEWYGEGFEDYLNTDDEKYDDFEDLARSELTKYKEVTNE